MIQIKSYPQDSKVTGYDSDLRPIYDRKYTSADLREVYKSQFSNGYASLGDSEGEVTATNTGVSVAPGVWVIEGVFSQSAEPVAIELEKAEGLKASIVVRLDTSDASRDVSIGARQSLAGYPAPVREGDVYELVIAHVDCDGGVFTVTDTREDEEVCGDSRSTLAGPRGPQGEKGPQGDTGPQGEKGKDGASTWPEVSGKPFETVGKGLSVSDGALTADVQEVPQASHDTHGTVITSDDYDQAGTDDSDVLTRTGANAMWTALKKLDTNNIAPIQVSVAPTATGANSTAVGKFAAATGAYSAVFGMNAQAPDDCANSVVFGAATSVSAANTVAVGQMANAATDGSVAIGQGASASGNNSIAIGKGAEAASDYEFSVGGPTSYRRVTHLNEPQEDTDAATKHYVDSAAGSRSVVFEDSSAVVSFSDGQGNLTETAIRNFQSFEPGIYTMNFTAGITSSSTAVAPYGDDTTTTLFTFTGGGTIVVQDVSLAAYNRIVLLFGQTGSFGNNITAIAAAVLRKDDYIAGKLQVQPTPCAGNGIKLDNFGGKIAYSALVRPIAWTAAAPLLTSPEAEFTGTVDGFGCLTMHGTLTAALTAGTALPVTITPPSGTLNSFSDVHAKAVPTSGTIVPMAASSVTSTTASCSFSLTAASDLAAGSVVTVRLL